MKVSPVTILISFLASMFMGAGVSLMIHYNNPGAGHRMQLVVGLSLVVVFIAIIGTFAHYQQTLKKAKRNLDEAQQLAMLGSWERDLVTGRGYWSDNRYRLFGLTPRAAAPSHEEFFSMIHPDDREQVRATVESAVQCGSGYEIAFRQANDIHNRIFFSRGQVLHDDSGRPVKIMGTTQDITEKCRQEDFLRDLVIQKSLFITRLGHDLKTPLTPLVALLPMIRDRATDEKQRTLIDSCIRSSTIIRDLVNKAMDLARRSSIHRPIVNSEDLALAAWVDEFLEYIGQMIKNHSVLVLNRVGRDLTVHADRTEMEELFRNLISNAIKFSPCDARVSIEAGQHDDQVCVRVTDAGIGLSQEEKSLIFDAFYKADASRHELGSSGLGLAICKQIVENHGGRIWAESDGKGQGTSICFTLRSGG